VNGIFIWFKSSFEGLLLVKYFIQFFLTFSLFNKMFLKIIDNHHHFYFHYYFTRYNRHCYVITITSIIIFHVFTITIIIIIFFYNSWILLMNEEPYWIHYEVNQSVIRGSSKEKWKLMTLLINIKLDFC
jgi:hypothetical protein